MLTFTRKNLSVALAGLVVGSSLTWRAGLDTPDAARPEPDVPAASLDWGDDYNHFIVDAAGRGEPTQSNEALRSTDDRETLAPVRDERTLSPAVQQAVATGRLVLTEPRTDSERAAATALPAGNLFAVDADGEFWGVDSATGAVRRAGPMPPSQAQPAPARGSTVSDGPASGDATGAGGDVVVGAIPPADAAFVAALAANTGIVEVRPLGHGQAAIATTLDIDAVRALELVGRVEVDVLLDLAATNDPRYGQQWMLDNTGASSQSAGWPGLADADMDVPAAWTVANGAGSVVAVIDTGVAIDHPDLADTLWRSGAETCGNRVDDDSNGFVDDCVGWNFGTGTNDPRPDPAHSTRNHGTHVAGIIAAAANNGIGVAGVAPGAQHMALRIANANGALSSSALVAAIRYAADNGAHIINLSLATAPNTPRANVASLEEAVGYARARGVTIVAGAGNNGVELTGEGSVWPAGFSLYYDNVIAVGATTNADAKASYSNWGRPVNVHAPGSHIMSTWADGFGYEYSSGTSMATPAVAGAAAILRASGQATTPSAIRSRLISTSEVLGSVGPRVNAALAVGVTDAGSTTSAVSFSGLDGLQPDTTSPVGATVRVSRLPANGGALRLSVATLEGAEVLAVDGVQATIAGHAHVTDASGAFPAVALTSSATSANGWTAALSTALPAGEYAVVSEIVDATTGELVTQPSAVFFTVTDAPAPDAPSAPPPGASSTTTSAPTGATPTTAASNGAPSTTTPSGATPTSSATTSSSTTTSSVDRATSSTATSTSTTTAGSGRATSTTSPSSNGATTTTSTSTPGATTVTTLRQAPGASTTTTVASGAGTSTTTGGSGGGTSQPSQPAPPPPTSDGPWRADSISPRTGRTGGGTAVTITGAFPTGRNIYVWFGGRSVTTTSPTGTSVTAISPNHTPGLVDVSVRFTDAGRSYELVLADAFLYADGLPSNSTTTTVASGVATTTTPSQATPTSTSSPSSPTTSAPAPGPTSVPTTSTTPFPEVQRGALTLRRPTPGTALASIGPNRFSTARCSSPTCPSGPLS